jgi:hypothetical protein
MGLAFLTGQWGSDGPALGVPTSGLSGHVHGVWSQSGPKRSPGALPVFPDTVRRREYIGHPHRGWPLAGDRSRMTLHCLLAGMALHYQAVHPAPPGATLADWVRRVGVVAAVFGTAVAAPEGTARLWRWITGPVRWAWRKVRPWLARYLPFLRRSATVYPTTAGDSAVVGTVGVRATGFTWNPDAPLEDQVRLLHEQMIEFHALIFTETDKARQEAREGDAELRQMIEQHVGELRALHEAHQVAHVAAQQQAARVDARGVVLLGLGVVMTGAPDGLARFAWLGWLVIVGVSAVTIWFVLWVIHDMRKAG